MYKSENNKFLVLKRNDGGNLVIVLDDFLDGVLVSLDPFFEEKGVRATATSGIRTEDEQMELIRQKALKANLDLVYLDCATADLRSIVHAGGHDQPYWQILWSQLLAKGQMINPPIPAKAEFEYRHADGRTIPAGNKVGLSEHQRAEAIDLSRNDLNLIARTVMYAVSKGVNGITKVLVEPNNGAVHLSCRRG